MGDRRPTARNSELRSMPCASDNSPHPEHPRLIHPGGACRDCRIWRLAPGNPTRSILFVLVANARAERQAALLQRISNGYSGDGVIRPVRSSEWFAKQKLCGQGLTVILEDNIRLSSCASGLPGRRISIQSFPACPPLNLELSHHRLGRNQPHGSNSSRHPGMPGA